MLIVLSVLDVTKSRLKMKDRKRNRKGVLLATHNLDPNGLRRDKGQATRLRRMRQR